MENNFYLILREETGEWYNNSSSRHIDTDDGKGIHSALEEAKRLAKKHNMRKFAKVDRNHKIIVDSLRKYGATVQSLATIGNGCPDIVVGFMGYNLLMEIKVPGCKLTIDESVWHDKWNGTVFVVHSPLEAINCVQFVCGRNKIK